jgi:hypothetical protein
MSFLRYRITRLRKFTYNKIFIVTKYILFVYLKIKMFFGLY